jgi:hypothetical protein
MRNVLSILFVLLFSNPIFAADSVPIKGSVFLGEEGCPGGVKSADCILTFELSGKAAKLLYDGMRAKAVREECTGGLQKVDGNGLNCIKSDDGTYNCDFGYQFSKQAFSSGAVDC